MMSLAPGRMRTSWGNFGFFEILLVKVVIAQATFLCPKTSKLESVASNTHFKNDRYTTCT